MKLVLLIGILLCFGPQLSLKAQKYAVQPVPFNKVTIHDSFWTPRLEAHAHATLATCIAQTQDSTERINNFRKAAGNKEGKHMGIYFDDSDVYKAMEGIAYSLINNPNPEHEALLETWIDLIARSQWKDGYLNTYYTLNFPDQRLTDMEKHELYCGGHMIEAAIAYHRATGKETFLKVAIRFADFLDSTFGPGKRHWVTGHEEVELALVKLAHETHQQKYLELAHWLLEERGHGHGVGNLRTTKDWGPAYCQDDVPVSDISEIKGHAVRAMYLFTGMADVAAEKEISAYVEALERVWEDVVMRNMYITGGIGSSLHNEGFTNDYDLPNKEAYCETCASIGMVLWNNRMNLFSKDAKYVDVMERCMYNGVLSGISLDGKLFFYVNPLESDGDHHRQRWYGCACCPSNVSRFIPSIGNYIYMADEKELYVNLYIGSDSKVLIGNNEVAVTQKTQYPWSGKVEIEVKPAKEAAFAIQMRVPGWCRKYAVAVNGKRVVSPKVENGYVKIDRQWISGDKVTLDLEMPVEMVAADPKVKQNVGKRALQRGPLVYCAEQVDNKDINLDQVSIYPNSLFKEKAGDGILKNMTLVETIAWGHPLRFIPYFAWDNRDAGKMKVWMEVSKK